MTAAPEPADPPAAAPTHPCGLPRAAAPAAGPPDHERPDPRVRVSGLRNPAAAMRGLGSGVLIVQTVALLLAIVPLRMLAGASGGWAIAAVCLLAVAALVLAGLMRHRWAWAGGAVLQVAVLAAGWLHWSLGVLGVTFGLVWLYAWQVRRTVLG